MSETLLQDVASPKTFGSSVARSSKEVLADSQLDMVAGGEWTATVTVRCTFSPTPEIPTDAGGSCGADADG